MNKEQLDALLYPLGYEDDVYSTEDYPSFVAEYCHESKPNIYMDTHSEGGFSEWTTQQSVDIYTLIKAVKSGVYEYDEVIRLN